MPEVLIVSIMEKTGHLVTSFAVAFMGGVTLGFHWARKQIGAQSDHFEIVFRLFVAAVIILVIMLAISLISGSG